MLLSFGVGGLFGFGLVGFVGCCDMGLVFVLGL